MKRLMTTLIALALLAMPFAALAEENWYVSEGADLVRRIQELCLDENYCSIYAIRNEEVQAWLDKIRAADFAAPVSARALYTGEKDELIATLERISPMVEDGSFDTILKMSETARDELAKKLPSALMNLVSSKLGGAEWLMMGAVISTGRGYVAPEDFKPCVLMLEYPDQYEAFVTFQRSGEGVVGASAMIVPSGSAAFVDEYIGQITDYGIEVEIEELAVN